MDTKKVNFNKKDIPKYFDTTIGALNGIINILEIAKGIVTENKKVTKSDVTSGKLKDPYITLGVSPFDSNELIAEIWKTKSKYAHPDMPNGSTEIQRKLNEAWAEIKKERGIK